MWFSGVVQQCEKTPIRFCTGVLWSYFLGFMGKGFLLPFFPL